MSRSYETMIRSGTQVTMPENVRTELEQPDGVLRVAIDASSGSTMLVCDSDSWPSLDHALTSVLTREGISRDAVDVLFDYPSMPGVQRRVRFEDVQYERPHSNFFVVNVAIGWEDQSLWGRAEGEGGQAVELRVCAQATTAALYELLKGEVSFQLVGVKAVRVFDQDLVAVLLHSPQAPDRRMVGVSLVVDDPYRSAVLAVLNATNRLLGNYLVMD